jgi:hypothetical protein
MLEDNFKLGDLVVHVDIPHNQMIGIITKIHTLVGRASVRWFLKFNNTSDVKKVEFKDLVKLN